MRQLVKSGYEMRAIRSVDMFPHTDHVESIVMLEREDRRGGARGGAPPRNEWTVCRARLFERLTPRPGPGELQEEGREND